MKQIECTDRYKAMGIPYPDANTCCTGDCEGTGLVPIFRDETDATYRALWNDAHKKCNLAFWFRLRRFFKDWQEARKYGLKIHWQVCFGKCDGWHFVKCPICGGTGKRTNES